MQNKLNKGLIFLKSSVISMGVILLVLIAALFILKINQNKNRATPKCDNNLIIEVKSEIEEFEPQGNSIVVLMKPNQETGTQEIIKFDSNCGKVISRTTFHQTKPEEPNAN